MNRVYTPLFESSRCVDCWKARRRISKAQNRIIEEYKCESPFQPGFGIRTMRSQQRWILLVTREHSGKFDRNWDKKSKYAKQHRIARIKSITLNSRYEHDAAHNLLTHYLSRNPPDSYHAWEMRQLIGALSEHYDVYATDMIKCYLSDQRKQTRCAFEFCAKYLFRQIEVLEPQWIIIFGGDVLQQLRHLSRTTTRIQFNYDKRLRKQSLHSTVIGSIDGIDIDYSNFPSERQADGWTKGEKPKSHLVSTVVRTEL